FAVGMVGVTLIVSNWSLDQQAKILKDFGLAAVSIFGLLIALFIGVRTIYQEIEKRTIYMLVSKPIRRWKIILGKYSGLAATILVNVAAITACLLLVDYYVEGSVDWGLLPGVGLIVLEILLIIAFAIFFSTFTSPLLSAILTLTVYVLGHLAPSIKIYTQLRPEESMNGLLLAIYHLVPNLGNFDIKTAVVDHLRLPPHTIEFAVLYGLAYISVLLIGTCLVFERKDLK
ncbi:MAG TPA: hypothetical protein ENJ23_01415, partial [Bacteroidetes bacterium]|nr:hypothetical protein [Bacteroidota bacterium]